jgi:ALG11 mannosyltransferase N-terminus
VHTGSRELIDKTMVGVLIIVAEASTGCLVLLSVTVFIVAVVHRTIWPKRPRTLAFFHPFCSSGGGGERVLWKMIEALERFEYDLVIYTVDAPSDHYVKGEF